MPGTFRAWANNLILRLFGAGTAGMIEVAELSKRFGAVRAVRGISFSVGRGEIVGFLGPNGAGKTTTMRMLTTYLTPTSGRASISGHDVLDEPLEVRRKVGYLPENVPLYAEMRVREYLGYRAKLKDVPRSKRRSSIDYVLTRCGLVDFDRRILGQLSKGYRQRVGLADSLVHDPDLLILDEPTAGLDPIQVREVRTLIRELGERHTILLSTHIMSEVEAVCGRVILIARGRIAIDETLEKIQTGSAIVLQVRGPSVAIKNALETAKGVTRVTLMGVADGVASFEVQTQGEADLREPLAARVVQNGWALRQLDLRRSSLEERFVRAVSEAEISPDGVETEAA
jgi:ABC-2 type transport system ATP-binding protein